MNLIPNIFELLKHSITLTQTNSKIIINTTSTIKCGPFYILELSNGSLCAIANKDIDIACVTLVYSWSTCYSRLLPSSPPIMCCKITNLVYLLLKD